uniref:Uncharacterized protein n=1 Tax=Rhizophora mucronata TaxID=61149 RepID=A0A2P2NGK7_RHIMU
MSFVCSENWLCGVFLVFLFLLLLI